MERVYEIVLTFAIGALLSGFFVNVSTKASVIHECNNFGAFSADGKVYECKPRGAGA